MSAARNAIESNGRGGSGVRCAVRRTVPESAGGDVPIRAAAPIMCGLGDLQTFR